MSVIKLSPSFTLVPFQKILCIWFLVVVPGLLLLALPEKLRAQTFSLEYDLNNPTKRNDERLWSGNYQVARKFSMFASLRSGNFDKSEERSQWGVDFCRRSISISPIGGGGAYSIEQSATSLSLAYDFLLIKTKLFFLSAGAAVGPGIFSEKRSKTYDPCDSFFCDLPKTHWQFTPNLKFVVPMFRGISAVVGARRVIYSDSDSNGLIEPGLIFSLGVQIEKSMAHVE